MLGSQAVGIRIAEAGIICLVDEISTSTHPGVWDSAPEGKDCVSFVG